MRCSDEVLSALTIEELAKTLAPNDALIARAKAQYGEFLERYDAEFLRGVAMGLQWASGRSDTDRTNMIVAVCCELGLCGEVEGDT